MEPSRSGHLPINGLQLYYEVYGDLGVVPLLLVPGAFLSTTSMERWVATFAPARPVIVFDQQGHGRTPDTPRPMSYEQFGDDAAELLRALEVEHCDVMGYSQGGAVGLQLALRHPELVRRLVVLSATYRPDGWYPSVPRAIEGVRGELFADTPIGEAFRRHTPDPGAFDAYVEKMKVLGIEDHHISDEQMHSIPAPTMVIVGDADGLRPEHAVAMFALRGGGDEEAAATGELSETPRARLVVLPATSHISIFAAVPVLAPMITDFLDDAPPAAASLW
ncbi:alpha/beta fold hydrolase [Actinomycetospora aeridis]|uniref:Alpha/beta hydrolase n=1 Tax=Actinomycetospora aeridis TaxID=3129231 RepID=A0ABU8N9M1_9PSEU